MDYQGRICKVQQAIASQGLDALILGLGGTQNITYLTGARVMALVLLVSPMEYVAFAAPTEFAETAEHYPDMPLKPMTRFSFQEIVEQLNAWQVKRLGFESGTPYSLYVGLQQAVGSIELLPASAILETLQRIKDVEEIALMRQASAINDAAMRHIQSYLKPGVTEREIAIEAEYFMRKAGAERANFVLVQFGTNSALPHALPSDRKLQAGDLVLLDWGPVYEGYASDVTRTWVVGKPNRKQQEIHDLVRRAQEAALAAVRPDMPAKEADAVARNIITAGGYGDAFLHRLGHGMNVGPDLNPMSEDILQTGMAFSIEPGIYLPGWGGIRIEDTVVLTEKGGEAMDQMTKELLIF